MTPPQVTAHAQDDRTPDALDARLTRLLQRVAARPGVHHAVMAVESGDGRRRWRGAAGPANGAPPVRPETPFFIASITKRFIAVLVLQAHERGELDLGAPITALLPPEEATGLHVLRGTDRTPSITVRHLATHTSGLPDHFEKRRGGPSLDRHLATGRDTAWTFEDTVRITRREQRPHFAPQDLTSPRQKARYSDTGFQLLIRILEEVTGRPFPVLLDERLLAPLGLGDTWLPGHRPPRAEAAEPAPLHAGRRRVELPSLIASSNDLYSTVGDLLAFQRALLGGAPFSDRRSLAALTERRNRLRNAPVLSYGLGTMFFRVGRAASPLHRPVTLIGHSGATGTWLFHCPELDVHLAGTVDQTAGRALPFRTMARCLDAWRA